jgi:hypothetical protein
MTSKQRYGKQIPLLFTHIHIALKLLRKFAKYTVQVRQRLKVEMKNTKSLIQNCNLIFGSPTHTGESDIGLPVTEAP